MSDDQRHGIVNVSHRGILGGFVNYCSCGASVIEPDGGHEATDAHLAGPPSPPRKPRTYRQRPSVEDVARVLGEHHEVRTAGFGIWSECSCRPVAMLESEFIEHQAERVAALWQEATR